MDYKNNNKRPGSTTSVARILLKAQGSSWIRRTCTASLLLVTTFLWGCSQMGPQVIMTGRPQYNVAVQQTEAQQLLLNIVRNRYNDPVLFLDITSITSGFSRGVNAGVLGTFGAGSDSGIGNVGGDFRENPNIFYAPNTGEKFVRQMLTPIDLRTIALLLQAGRPRGRG